MTAADPVAPSTHRTRKAPNPWRVAVIAGMASFIDAAAIAGTGTALVLFQGELGLTGDQIGQLSALLTFTIAIGAFIGGRLGDRFGRRRVFTVTLALAAIGAALATFAWDPAVLYVALALIGFGTGADLPVSMAMISESAPESKRGKMITFSHVLWMVGIVAVIVLGIVAGGLGGVGARAIYGFVVVVSAITLLLRATLPESEEWRRANEARTASIASVDGAGDIGALGRLFRSRFVLPLIALGLFYALINVSANTMGQFGTYLYVNVAGSDVSTASALSLIGLAMSFVGMFTLMRVVDTRFRMVGFAIASVLSLGALVLPLTLGVTVPILVLSSIIGALGGAVAGEPMFKVWAQELFPTLYRSSAQGIMIAFTRVIAAVAALFTPALIAVSPQVLYGVLTAATAAALAIGMFWVARIRKAEGEAGVGATGDVVAVEGDAIVEAEAEADAPGRAAADADAVPAAETR
ncbi:MFS transporter [Agromyces sp. MMS24-K17]|uniref:MFS transporter n=1 Tax=Agromyces sp. MMS24-K17 TaxID=3372850 RepID=UPI0037547C25